jgi:hypothetical protein
MVRCCPTERFFGAEPFFQVDGFFLEGGPGAKSSSSPSSNQACCHPVMHHAVAQLGVRALHRGSGSAVAPSVGLVSQEEGASGGYAVAGSDAREV